MSRKSSRQGVASALAHLTKVLLVLLLSTPVLGAADLAANEYGEIDETPMVAEPATLEESAGLAAASEEMGVEEGEEAIVESSIEPKDLLDSSEAAMSSGEDATTAETIASTDSEESEEEVEEAGPTMAEAVVYVFNNDDDTLSVSLFIDSELKDTEDVAKEKEKKFGNYQLEAGSHKFKISWWDDDTKKTHEEELIATVEDVTAITLYATQNKEPEEFEVNVMLRNDNQEDLEAYLYIDGEYEKQKTAKKESTTDFGKFDLEEGTHELAVRWQDPETNIEYEKRKTVRVDGTDVVTFYAPQGMTFESADEKAATTATSSKTTSSKTASASTTTKTETKEDASKTGENNSKQPSTDSGEVKTTAEKAKTSQVDKTADDREPTPEEKSGDDGPGVASATLYLSTIGAILAIYIIFFRR